MCVCVCVHTLLAKELLYIPSKFTSVIWDKINYTLVQAPSSGNVLELRYGKEFEFWSIIDMGVCTCGR